MRFDEPGSRLRTERRGRLPARYFYLKDREDGWQGHVRMTAVLRPDGTVLPYDRPVFPKLKQGALVDLVIATDDLADEKERIELTAERKVVLFDAGTELRARISPRHLSENDKAGCLIQVLNGVFPRPGYFVAIELKDPLSLVIRPNRRSSLADVECRLPCVQKTAVSVNEAYRLLSERFEHGRRSRGGNVFLTVHYNDEGTWLPLDALRRWCEAGMAVPWAK